MTTTADAMTQGFITAMLWADGVPAEMPDPVEYGGLQHLEPTAELTAAAFALCDAFRDAAVEDVSAFMDAFGDPDGGHPGEYVGHTFYLDAAGHGVSFTDRAWRSDDPMTAVCLRLRDTAKQFPQVEHMTAWETSDGKVDLG